VLAEADVETERGVILEEIAMADDEPGDEVHDLFADVVYGGHPLGRRISGTPHTISALTREQILTFYRGRYAAPSIVVAAAGNLDHAEVADRVAAAFGHNRYFDAAGSPAPGRPLAPVVPVAGGAVNIQNKDTEQAHVVFGCAGLTRHDERRFALGALNNVLGGGMSSRLFQQIRERRGLAYSVYSYTSQYADSGLFAVYAGCAPGKVDEVLALTRDELAKVAAEGVTDAEVARGKGMLKGSLVLGLEDTGSRMSRLGKGELLYQDMLTVDALLARIDAVRPEDVRAVAAEVLANPASLAIIGPFDDRDFSGIVV
jgi:predicted Zn-dependent peptidase